MHKKNKSTPQYDEIAARVQVGKKNKSRLWRNGYSDKFVPLKGSQAAIIKNFTLDKWSEDALITSIHQPHAVLPSGRKIDRHEKFSDRFAGYIVSPSD